MSPEPVMALAPLRVSEHASEEMVALAPTESVHGLWNSGTHGRCRVGYARLYTGGGDGVAESLERGADFSLLML